MTSRPVRCFVGCGSLIQRGLGAGGGKHGYTGPGNWPARPSSQYPGRSKAPPENRRSQCSSIVKPSLRSCPLRDYLLPAGAGKRKFSYGALSGFAGPDAGATGCRQVRTDRRRLRLRPPVPGRVPGAQRRAAPARRACGRPGRGSAAPRRSRGGSGPAAPRCRQRWRKCTGMPSSRRNRWTKSALAAPISDRLADILAPPNTLAFRLERMAPFFENPVDQQFHRVDAVAGLGCAALDGRWPAGNDSFHAYTIFRIVNAGRDAGAKNRGEHGLRIRGHPVFPLQNRHGFRIGENSSQSQVPSCGSVRPCWPGVECWPCGPEDTCCWAAPISQATRGMP